MHSFQLSSSLKDVYLRDKPHHDKIKRTASARYVFVSVRTRGDSMELTIGNNPAISTPHSPAYHWSQKEVLKNTWLDIHDSNVDILNVTVPLNIKKVKCIWIDVIDMLSVNIFTEGPVLWYDYFNHSSYNMLERYFNVEDDIEYRSHYNDSNNLLDIHDSWNIKGELNYFDPQADKYIMKKTDVYCSDGAIFNHYVRGDAVISNRYHHEVCQYKA